MALDYTSTKLVADLKRRSSYPTSEELHSDQELCDFMTDCQEFRVVPQIMKTREEHFVSTVDIPLVNGQDAYDLPERAIGAKIRHVYILSKGSEDDTRSLPRLEPEDAVHYGNLNYRAVSDPAGYYFEANKIRIVPTPNTTNDVIRLVYYRRPSRIVTVDQTARITAIDTNLNQITVEAFPADFADGDYDIVKAKPPFSSSDDVAITAVNTVLNTASVPADVIGNLSVGDYVCSPGETPIPQLQADLHRILVQYAIVKVLESLGDLNGVQLSAASLDELEQSLYTMLEHRDESSPRSVSLKNTMWRNSRRLW